MVQSSSFSVEETTFKMSNFKLESAMLKSYGTSLIYGTRKVHERKEASLGIDYTSSPHFS